MSFIAIKYDMRICTYNIHGGTDEARKPSLPQIKQSLTEVKADIYLLQEVDRFLPRSRFADQARSIASALQATCYFYGRLRLGRSAFGNAILSRLPVIERTRLPLPSDGGEPRCAVGVMLEDGCSVWSVHLGLQDSWRETQLATLAEALTPYEQVIVGGDFNAGIDSPEVQRFLARTALTTVSPDLPTFPVSPPTHRIDFLFARGFSVEAGATIAGPGSDHCLVWTDLTPQRQPPPP